MFDIEKILINLNSKFASNYIDDSHSNCVFDLPNIEIPSQHHIHISVKNAIIPYSWYNVNKTNNLFGFTMNSLNYLYILDNGNYNINQFVKYLNQLIVASGLSCIYNSITNRLQFSHAVYNFTFVFSNFSCLPFLGFTAISHSSADRLLTSKNCLNLQSVQCIHIQTGFITNNINSSSKYTQNTLCTIPVSALPFSTIVYETVSNFSTNLYSNLLNEIHIKLADQDGNIIDLNGLDWSITLQVEIVDFVN